ncbi:MAG TPA: YcaO-like family protein [Beijerinckiaceae bacterium]|jgi:ribosomal protein S12 methylthiotransferase accessory factor
MSDLLRARGFNDLGDHPAPPLPEALARASRLVSNEVGLVKDVWSMETACEDPAVYRTWSEAADLTLVMGFQALNHGSAASLSRDRAAIKALGESIERYCAAHYWTEELVAGSYSEVRASGADATAPEDFALYSEAQYADPGFHFDRLIPDTRLRWEKGISLPAFTPTYVPAACVYIPYRYDDPSEARVWDSISTGLACSHTYASAIYKGIMECVERDAFMIVWHNRLSRPALPLDGFDHAGIGGLLAALRAVDYDVSAHDLSLDIPVPVVLVVCRGRAGTAPPLVAIGLGTDLDLGHALYLALEEACLGVCGMRQAAKGRSDFRTRPPYSNVTSLQDHGLAYAVQPELARALDFLEGTAFDRPRHSPVKGASPRESLRTAVAALERAGLGAVAVDVTTPDINETGFKVVRAVVPGLQPLDNNHNTRYLGGRRLKEVPVTLGLRDRPLSSRELNPYPHPFP